MNLFRLVTSAAARIVRDVQDAPRVARELRQIRAAGQPEQIPAPLTSDQVKGKVPDVETIEAAAREYEQAREQTNAAVRLKRAAEKILKRTPDGRHGAVVVERFESSRQVADLDQIKEIFERHGLGEVPLKRCAPSLTISWAEEAAEPHTLAVAA